MLAALCVGVAVFAGLRATASPPPASTEVLVVAKDLPAGAVLTSTDLVWREFAPDSVPAGVLDQAAGRILAGPMRAGEPVTDRALVGPGLAAGDRDVVVTPVRILDAESVGLLRVGDRIDLLATDLEGGGSTRVAIDVPVLATPAADPAAGDGLPGRLVVLGLPPGAVAAVTAASTQDALGFNFAT